MMPGNRKERFPSSVICMLPVKRCQPLMLHKQPAKTFSVAVHIEYPNGFIYDHAFATGVPTVCEGSKPRISFP